MTENRYAVMQSDVGTYNVMVGEWDEHEEDEPIFRPFATCSSEWTATFIVQRLRKADSMEDSE